MLRNIEILLTVLGLITRQLGCKGPAEFIVLALGLTLRRLNYFCHKLRTPFITLGIMIHSFSIT
jgi:hypothetical protein